MPKKWWWNSSFWAGSFTNMKFDPRIICTFKKVNFWVNWHSHSSKLILKTMDYSYPKMPKFVDPIFHQIWLWPKDLTTLPQNLKIFCEMLSFRKKSQCSHTLQARAENECKKSLMGPGGSKKIRIQYFWNPFGSPFGPPPGHQTTIFFTHS